MVKVNCGNVAGLLIDRAASTPEAPAIVEGADVVSYAELANRAAVVAAHLTRVGVRPGDRVVVYYQRGATAAASFFATLAIGGVVVMADVALRARQLEHLVDHCGATRLMTSEATLARLPRTPAVTAPVDDLTDLSGDVEFAVRPSIASDTAVVIYTSGSTGAPKGIALSHGNLRAGVASVSQYLGLDASDRIASLLPFSFDYGLNQLLCTVATGSTLIVERSPLAPRIVKSIAEQAVTVLPAVPPLWLQLLNVHSFTDKPLPELRIMTNTGGRLPATAVKALRTSHPHADLFLMYGLTEAFRSTYLDPRLVDTKPDSIGRAIPGAEVEVVDDHGSPCPPFEHGQLIHRGPTVALGYWNDPDATAIRFRPNPLSPTGTPATELVVYSGDTVYRDEDGDLFFVGRSDAMIKTLGHRVSPDEITETMYDSGQVVEAIAVAEPDDERGSVIIAYAVLSPDGDIDVLWEFVRRELPRYMHPARIEPIERIERTTSGKFDIHRTVTAHDT